MFELACLAHAVPGVSLRLIASSGDELLVSASCLGAELDPCRLRAALATDRTGMRIALTTERVEVVSGLVHVGGGLYQRTHPQGAGERWFVVASNPDRLVHLIASIHLDGPAADEVEVTVGPDSLLGLCAVRIRAASDAAVARLDDLAFTVLAACVVDEFVTSLTTGVSERH
ncbi:MAG: hypothetical protein CL424_18495 [Acidimicrobiaceae bacterium]|nr:hypothetical protein [Acidimicrobiaceae bacterium]